MEHSTIPPYLWALYSIVPGRNSEAVEALSTVVVEEVLHLTLAANLPNAVGGPGDSDDPPLSEEAVMEMHSVSLNVRRFGQI